MSSKIMTVLLTSFQCGCLLFPCLWLLGLGLPVPCWITGEGGHPCHVPDLKGNTSSFCPLSVMLAVGFAHRVFIMLSYTLSIPTLLSFVLFFIINRCWVLSNTFFYICYMIWWFLSFILFMWYITFSDLWILYQPCIPGINPTWSYFMIFLLYCWIHFASIYWAF